MISTLSVVFGQVSGKAGDRVRAAPLGGEQHPPEFHVGEDAHVGPYPIL